MRLGLWHVWGDLFSCLLLSSHISPSSQVGFINSLKFSSSGDFLVAGVGQEHRYEAPLEGGGGWASGWVVGAGPGFSVLWFRPLQTWPLVADQRGSELHLHHPAPQGPQAPRWLLTLLPFI